jgi:hypothetical protein
LRIFLSLGGFFLLSGTAYGLWRAISTGRGLPVTGLLLIVTGVLLVMFGLVADQISRLRLSPFSGPTEEDHEEITTGAIGALDERLAPIPALVGDGTDDDTPT